MPSPVYSAFSPTTVLADDVSGAGGTALNASTFTTLRTDLATYIQNHISGAANNHGTVDLLDYGPASALNLAETTAYVNAAPNAASLYTQWQRNDMFAALFKAVLGGAGATLTLRKAAFDALAGGADLTTLYNKIAGGTGAVSFGSVTATSPGAATAAGIFKGAATDPAQFVFVTQSNGGVTRLSIDNFGTLVAYGGAALVAKDLATTPTLALSSLDNSAGRKVLSLRYNNNTENGFLANDGSGTLGALTVSSLTNSGAATVAGAFTANGTAAFANLIDVAGIAAPALSAAGKSRMYTDTGGVVRISQNGGPFLPLNAAASASGGIGAIQFAGSGGAFSSDATNLWWDNANKRLGILTSAPTNALSVNGIIAAQGTLASLAFYDRSGAPGNYGLWYRDSANSYLNASETGNLFTMNNATGIATMQGVQLSQVIPTRTPFSVTGVLAGTADLGVIDSSAIANGVRQRWDFAGREYQTQASPPTIVAGAAAGTGPTVSVLGTDQEGTITIVTGTATSGSNGLLATFTFRNALAAAPKGVITEPVGLAAGNLGSGVMPFTGGYAAGSFQIISGATALAASTSYTFSYRVII